MLWTYLVKGQKNMFAVLKRAFVGFQKDNCSRTAAAMAYYTAFALAPTLLLILSVCQLLFEPQDIRGQIESQISDAVGPQGAAQVKAMLTTDESSEKRGILATVIGIATMLVGATGLFSQLQAALNDIWGVKPDPRKGGFTKFLRKRLVSLGMLLTIAFLFIVSATVSAGLQAFDERLHTILPGQAGMAIAKITDYGVSFVLISCLFAAIFKILPDAQIDWSTVWFGAITTSVLFALGKYGIALYVGSQNTTAAYGAAGSLIVILLWVYYSALILLFGAEVTQAWSEKRGNSIQPEPGAVRVDKSIEPTDDVHRVQPS